MGGVDKPFACKLCDKAFSYRRNLKSHASINNGDATAKMNTTRID